MKVWQTDFLVCSHTYRPAQADMIISAAIHPEQSDLVVSCAEDGKIILWDLRMPKPALGIYLLHITAFMSFQILIYNCLNRYC